MLHVLKLNFRRANWGEKNLSPPSLRVEKRFKTCCCVVSDRQPFQILKRGNVYNSDFAEDGVKIPSGHPEGIFDAMGNIYKGVAKAINKEKSFSGEYPELSDGVRGMLFIEKAITSNNNGNIWVEL